MFQTFKTNFRGKNSRLEAKIMTKKENLHNSACIKFRQTELILLQGHCNKGDNFFGLFNLPPEYRYHSFYENMVKRKVPDIFAKSKFILL